MSEGEVRLAIDGVFARITIDRPSSRNAMTFAMYDELLAALGMINTTKTLRVALITGVDRNFCAGTDIAEFLSFTSGEDGVAYERRMETVLSAIEQLDVPIVAAIDGPTTGGGLLIAACCDFRIASTRSRFGAPIARTLGNVLSLRNTRRLERGVGLTTARRILLLAELVDASAAASAGFVLDVVEPEMLLSRAQALLDQLTANAPLTIAASRRALNRLAALEPLDDDDLIRDVYGSDDFRDGVRAFVEKRKMQWSGR